jgi:hypothetical protein
LLELNGRALHAPIGTENAAGARHGLEQSVTTLALVEEDARIGRHVFLCGGSARGASERRLQNWFHGGSNDVQGGGVRRAAHAADK